MVALIASAWAGEFVVVAAGAVLRAPDGEVLVAERATPMRAVGREGADLVVLAVPDDGLHCIGGWSEPITDLRFRVDASAVEVVLTESWTEARPGGTWVRLRAGSWLARDPDGGWTWGSPLHDVRVHPPGSVLGTSYDPDRSWPVGRLGSDPEMRDMDHRLGDGEEVTAFLGEPVRIRRLDGGLEEVTGRCLALAGRPLGEGWIQMHGWRLDEGTWKLRSGTALVWPDGRPAGKLVGDALVTPTSDRGRQGCFPLYVAGAPLTVCADPGSSTVLEVPPAGATPPRP